MKLKAFYWGKVQAFKISKESSEFKEKYPKRFIVVSASLKSVFNVDDVNDVPVSFWDIDYLFTYENIRATAFGHPFHHDWPDEMTTVPMNLHNYFANSSDCNVVMKILARPTNKLDPRLIYSIVMRNNIDELQGVDFKKSFDSIIKSVYAKLPIHDTETWLEYLLDTFPMDAENNPYDFPNVISDETFKKPLNVSLKNFMVGYVIREPSLSKELALISALEQQLNDLSMKLIIRQNYSNLLERVKEQAKRQKLNYKELSKDRIEMKASDFYKLNMKFTILDMITTV